ncbi:GNAT family N-acetyltransferase [Allokutzneria albata]|uniref:Ribosomal-protein-alanine N-acetyltransferase n=1 Tax=Allokutzneria albata TaxID=211114 RepID=A0A1H0B4N7_ALLAB|nr:GNAT family protein [Allokutzneria albata]SDN40585.1 ribosomal-protein-alanine N-acetyltransferase [Allokutzneria albata]
MADFRPPEGRHPGWPARLGPLVVAGGTLELRPPRLRDASAWSSTRQRDRAHLERWEPSSYGQGWEERNSLLAWPPQWAALRSLARRGLALPFMIVVDGRLAGQVTVGNIQRGALRSGWVGYWVASELTGGGVATAAVALVADHSFGPAGLHRLEATVRPENEPSLRVLDKLGFRREGLYERYLDVGGAWRDHLSLAFTEEEVGAGMVARLVRRGLARIP